MAPLSRNRPHRPSHDEAEARAQHGLTRQSRDLGQRRSSTWKYRAPRRARRTVNELKFFCSTRGEHFSLSRKSNGPCSTLRIRWIAKHKTKRRRDAPSMREQRETMTTKRPFPRCQGSKFFRWHFSLSCLNGMSTVVRIRIDGVAIHRPRALR